MLEKESTEVKPLIAVCGSKQDLMSLVFRKDAGNEEERRAEK
jgi:hypothetical protein